MATAPKRTKLTAIRVTDTAGTVHTGSGPSLAVAVRELGEAHVAEQRWTLTLEGAITAAAIATAEYIDAPTPEGAAVMERRYDLIEIVAWQGGKVMVTPFDSDASRDWAAEDAAGADAIPMPTQQELDDVMALVDRDNPDTDELAEAADQARRQALRDRRNEPDR